MKILMTTDTVGGVWSYSLELAQALQSHDVSVCLAAIGRMSDDQAMAAESLENLTLFAHDGKLEWMDDPWHDVAATSDWLMEISRAVQPDLVHLNEYGHGALSWNLPVVVVGHSCIWSWFEAVRGEHPPDKYHPYHDRVVQALSAADTVVAPTQFMLDALQRHYGRCDDSSVIWNGCSPDKFATANEKQPFIFSAGRFWDEAKNLSTLVAASPSLSWPIEVAGLPHPEGADGKADGVRWLGRLAQPEMRQKYCEAAIYALPARYEPFGLTPLEAAMSGCALVLGDIPSLREVWQDSAWFVPPNDVEAWIAALDRLTSDSTIREEFADRAMSRGKQFTAERMAEFYLHRYRQLLVNRPASITQGAASCVG